MTSESHFKLYKDHNKNCLIECSLSLSFAREELANAVIYIDKNQVQLYVRSKDLNKRKAEKGRKTQTPKVHPQK